MIKNKGPIVVIGGGISGIMAARTLLDLGEENVLLLDKGRGLGGRMNTRVFSGSTFDHGTSFFTAHSQVFKELVATWEEEGWVKSFPSISNGYFASRGMNALIRDLADPIDFCVRVRVTEIKQGKGRWVLRWISEGQKYVPQTYNEVSKEQVYDPGGDATIQARAIILTVPAPQALFLLDKGKVLLDDSIRTSLSSIDYAPCVSVMLALDREPELLNQGMMGTGLIDPIRSIIDNQKKGISSSPALTIQANEEWSRKHLWSSEEEIYGQLLPAVDTWLGEANILDKQIKRWTFSQATGTYPENFLDSKLDPPLVFAGDAFIGDGDAIGIGRVETAALSGIESAKYLIGLQKL